MRNWTIKEAVEAINKNDTDAIKEISRHFPMFFLAIARNDLQALAAMMPDKFTVRRLVMTDAAAESNDSADTEAADDSAESEDVDLNAMSTKELMKLCDKRGIKVPHYGKNKQFYLDALNGASGDDEAGDTESDEEDGGNPYEGKSAMELFKECKKRGIKCEPKKKAAYYVDLLCKDDEAADDSDSDDDGWGDGDDGAEAEQEEKKTTKGGSKSGGKGGARNTKKDTKPADDDDGWDI